MTTSRAEGPQLSRRERVREATVAEIKQTARDLLDTHGLAGVSLRAIAREMGMTAPGLYRYFEGLDDLLTVLRLDFFAELAAAVDQAIRSGPQDLDARVSTAIRAFRAWGVNHRTEYTLLFGPQLTDRSPTDSDERVVEAGLAFGSLFFGLFREIWEDGRCAPPPDDTLPAELTAQFAMLVRDFESELGGLPSGAVRLLLGAWIRLYGLISMEVFDPMCSMLGDMTALFEAEMRDVLHQLGVRYLPAEGDSTA